MCGGGNTTCTTSVGLKWRGLAYDSDGWKEKVYAAKFKATKGNISLNGALASAVSDVFVGSWQASLRCSSCYGAVSYTPPTVPAILLV